MRENHPGSFGKLPPQLARVLKWWTEGAYFRGLGGANYVGSLMVTKLANIRKRYLPKIKNPHRHVSIFFSLTSRMGREAFGPFKALSISDHNATNCDEAR
jgi:hypothetical protein